MCSGWQGMWFRRAFWKSNGSLIQCRRRSTRLAALQETWTELPDPVEVIGSGKRNDQLCAVQLAWMAKTPTNSC